MTIRDFASGSGVKLDPIIISIILSVSVFILQNCILKKKDIEKPSWLQKWRLKRICYKHSREHYNTVYEHILTHGPQLTQEDLDSLYLDCKQYAP